jgi:fido (protein-threonine AMPylation protein)
MATRRRVIAKGGRMFCYPESIDREMKKLFKQLAEAKYFKGLCTRKHNVSRSRHGRIMLPDSSGELRLRMWLLSTST